MTAPETAELRERTDEQLLQDLEESHQALFNLRFQAATRQLADVSQVGNTRRRIARIKTLLVEREIIAEADLLAADEIAAEAAEIAEIADTAEDAESEEAAEGAESADADGDAEDEQDEEAAEDAESAGDEKEE